jgi:hypothetical protein
MVQRKLGIVDVSGHLSGNADDRRRHDHGFPGESCMASKSLSFRHAHVGLELRTAVLPERDVPFPPAVASMAIHW